MRDDLASARQTFGRESVDLFVRRYLEDWQRGSADLAALLREADAEAGKTRSDDPEQTARILSALVKADLRCRFERGERPAVLEYLDRYPNLGNHSERVLSLAYEEFCLLEEQGVPTDSRTFCRRYENWTDSLASQLRYHRVLSRVAGVPAIPPRFPEPGEVFESYTLLGELGRGGAGRVYHAREESLGGREVALKVSADRGSEPAVLGRLEHPRIVPVLSVFRSTSTKLRGLCMPFRPGLPLDKVIERVNPADRPESALALWRALEDPAIEGAPRREQRSRPTGLGWDGFPNRGTYAEGVAWLVAGLADALAHAHKRNVLHRDVKPANILLTFREGPQLLDFNLAHDPEAAVDEAEAALRGGTLPYMSPEHLEAFIDPARWSNVGGPADIYSLGLVLRELLTGRAPDFPDQKLPLARAIREMLDRRIDFVPDIRRNNPDVPHALDAIARRCLAFLPSARYTNAADLATDLRHFLGHEPTKFAPNPSRRERTVNFFQRNRRRIAVLAVAIPITLTSILFADRIQNQLTDVRARTSWPTDLPLAGEEILSLGSDSPIWQVEVAAGYAQAKDFRKARSNLEAAWTNPKIDQALRDWGRAHPTFAERLGELGAQLYDAGLTQETSALRDLWVNSAEKPLLISSDLDASDLSVRFYLTHVDESRGRFQEAHEALSELIALPTELGKRSPPEEVLRQTRARVSANWVQRLVDNITSREKLAEADGTLAEALLDLDFPRTLKDPSAPFRNEYIRCEIHLLRAEIADRLGRDLNAIRAYDIAESRLAVLSSMPRSKYREAFETIEAKVWERLRTDRPRLEARWFLGRGISRQTDPIHGSSLSGIATSDGTAGDEF